MYTESSVIAKIKNHPKFPERRDSLNKVEYGDMACRWNNISVVWAYSQDVMLTTASFKTLLLYVSVTLYDSKLVNIGMYIYAWGGKTRWI